MATEENTENSELQGRSRALWLLGVTFVLPAVITLIAVYIFT